MTNRSSAILHQLTTALLNRDLFHIGYLLMAYAETGEDASVLKHRLMSWIAIETISNVSVDTCCNGDGSICCVDSTGALISLIQTHLDGTLHPSHYIRQVKSFGSFITENFSSANSQSSDVLAKYAVIDIATKERGLCNFADGFGPTGSFQFLLLPAQGERVNLCLWLPREIGHQRYVSAFPYHAREEHAFEEAVKVSFSIAALNSIYDCGSQCVCKAVDCPVDSSFRISLIMKSDSASEGKIRWLSENIRDTVSVWVK